MRSSIEGTKIYLDQIKSDGEEFVFTKESGTLNKTLEPLLRDKDYKIALKIIPHDAKYSYSIQGIIEAKMELLCSRCALDFDHEIHEEFNEIIIVDKEYNEEYVNSGQITPSELSGPYCTTLSEPELNIGEFLYEIIALAEPINPMGKENCDDTCDNYIKAVQNGWLEKIQEDKKRSQHNPFENLKDLI